MVISRLARIVSFSRGNPCSWLVHVDVCRDLKGFTHVVIGIVWHKGIKLDKTAEAACGCFLTADIFKCQRLFTVKRLSVLGADGRSKSRVTAIACLTAVSRQLVGLNHLLIIRGAVCVTVSILDNIGGILKASVKNGKLTQLVALKGGKFNVGLYHDRVCGRLGYRRCALIIGVVILCLNRVNLCLAKDVSTVLDREGCYAENRRAVDIRNDQREYVLVSELGGGHRFAVRLYRSKYSGRSIVMNLFPGIISGIPFLNLIANLLVCQ